MTLHMTDEQKRRFAETKRHPDNRAELDALADELMVCTRCDGLGWRAPDGPDGCAKCGGRKRFDGA